MLRKPKASRESYRSSNWMIGLARTWLVTRGKCDSRYNDVIGSNQEYGRILMTDTRNMTKNSA